MARDAKKLKSRDTRLERNPSLQLKLREQAAFQRRLLTWFERSRRDMPWRRTRDPYRIWLSEVMLQQTRVAAVVPYYERFLRRFPSLKKLAVAETEEVLRHWAGLGYYSRARNLHRAAQQMMERHGGKFPSEPGAALELAGIGRYTAAAVLSIAYGKPLAVLDGNVARVLARLFAIRGDLRAPKRWKQLEIAAQELLASSAAGDWNQAMMELGATVCTPRNPRCGECPVAKWCRAKAMGIAEELPAKRKKRATEEVRLGAAVVVDGGGKTLLVRGEEAGYAELFSRMWQFPAFKASAGGKGLRNCLRENSGLNGQRMKMEELRPVRHSVTYRKVTIQPYLVRVTELPENEQTKTVRLEEVDSLVVSNATRKIVREALRVMTGAQNTPPRNPPLQRRRGRGEPRPYT